MNPLLIAGLAYIALSSNRQSGESVTESKNDRQQPQPYKGNDPTVKEWFDYIAKLGGAVADVVNAAKR